MEFIFLGTGTSSGVPLMNCLAQRPITCKVCESGLAPLPIAPSCIGIPAKYSKNKRRNTSCLYRYRHGDGSIKNVLIDCGKTFYESAITWFPEYHLRNIDAVIITHGHADAVNGFDDLRMWTAGGEKQLQKSVDIYLDKESMQVVEKAFPYLCNSDQATGSGEIASLNFHLFETNKPFTLFNELLVEPFPVEHGFYADKTPYYANGFRMGEFCYVSDTSHIPKESIDKMMGCKYLVIDALRLTHHVSHFGYSESLQVCQDTLSSSGRAFFTGMGHDNDHDEINDWIQQNMDHSKNISIETAYDGLKVEMKREKQPNHEQSCHL